LGGVRFSIDEWMAGLFWMDTPQPLVPAWSIERVERCMARIWSTAAQVAARGVLCVLDIGFGEAAKRARFAALAENAKLPVRLHFLDVSPAERWRRVQTRNAEKGATYQLPFDITREMFDFVETMWEPPGEAEMIRYNGIRV